MTKRRIALPKQLSEEIQELFDTLNDGSDLTAALIAASHIDDYLGTLLKQHLVDCGTAKDLLETPGGLLTTLHARASLCYSLGLIGKLLFKDVLTIAEIRNEFAHHRRRIDFATKSVAVRCERLGYAHYVFGDAKGVSSTKRPVLRASARSRFNLAVVQVASRVLVTAHGTVRCKPRTENRARLEFSV